MFPRKFQILKEHRRYIKHKKSHLKKKRRINSFKNWLLARDSASRISTFPKYHSFLENLEPSQRSREEIMALLSKIKDNKPFFKLQKLTDYELYLDGHKKECFIKFSRAFFLTELRIFSESFNIKKGFKNILMRIRLNDPLDQTQILDEDAENSSYKYRSIVVEIPSSFDDSKIVKESERGIETWIEGVDLGEDFLNDFFKWWMKNFLFVQERYDNFLKSFQSALVEWMKQAPLDLVEKAYTNLIHYSKDASFDRWETELGNEEVVSHVNQGIKIFGIKIENIQKGTDLLTKFGL